MLASIIRTVVLLIVALILGQAARVGLDLDPGAVTSIVTAVIGGAVYSGVRWAEERWPAAGWLLGLARAPSYGTGTHAPVRVVLDNSRASAEFLEALRKAVQDHNPPR